MKEPLLLIDVTQLICRARSLSLSETGSVLLVALAIAANGPLPVSDIRKTAKLRGRQKWIPEWNEARLFERADGLLHLGPDVFRAKTRGSDDRQALPAGIRSFIHERDGYQCSYCGTANGPFHIDHIVPVSRGGDDDLENLCLACVRCNCSKSNKLLSEWSRA